MDKLAVGAVFRLGHNRGGPDDNGMDFVKITNMYAYPLDGDKGDARPNTSGSENDAANLKVTYMGSTRTIMVTRARP
ncbi:MAG: hypothetical protein AB7V18_19560 [Pyrinomonadaceae bacterium]